MNQFNDAIRSINKCVSLDLLSINLYGVRYVKAASALYSKTYKIINRLPIFRKCTDAIRK